MKKNIYLSTYLYSFCFYLLIYTLYKHLQKIIIENDEINHACSTIPERFTETRNRIHTFLTRILFNNNNIIIRLNIYKTDIGSRSKKYIYIISLPQCIVSLYTNIRILYKRIQNEKKVILSKKIFFFKFACACRRNDNRLILQTRLEIDSKYTESKNPLRIEIQLKA